MWNQILVWEGVGCTKKSKASERTESKGECHGEDEVCHQSGDTKGG